MSNSKPVKVYFHGSISQKYVACSTAKMKNKQNSIKVCKTYMKIVTPSNINVYFTGNITPQHYEFI